MDVYILVRAEDQESVAAALEAADGFLSMSVRRASSMRPSQDGRGVFAVARVGTLNSPDTVLARLDEVGSDALESGRVLAFEILLAGNRAWDSEVLVLPSPRLLDGDEATVAAVLEVGPDVRLPDGRLLSEVALPGSTASAGDARLAATLRSPTPEPGITAAGHAPIPDWDAAYLWAHEGVEWVPVDMAWGWQMDVEIRLARLLDARIPATLDTRPFAEHQGWFFGALFMSKILVPPSRAEEARELLAAGFDDPDGVFGDDAEDELNQLYWERPFYQFAHWGLWAYIVSQYGVQGVLFYAVAAVNAVADLAR